ncbi:hypothetical protein [Pseudobutyrivibrio ruminis]|nr:hypothetical protein [Pseudobutyrivibrio ruminis]
MENVRKVEDIIGEKYYIARPLKTMAEDSDRVRLNFVTDDISKKSLFGGVATALIFATFLCESKDWTLRIITRYYGCDVTDYYDFLKMLDIKPPKRVETYSDEDKDAENLRLSVSSKDVFFATSWWSAKSILDSDICKRFIYIIQEEETFFYPQGDDRFECANIMNNENIDFIVNSKLLYNYLQNNGYDTLCKNAVYFEPAFSKKLYFADDKSFEKGNEKKKLFFYCRPNNPRNLYYFGLKCLDEALRRNIIDTDVWEVYLAGSDSYNIEFSNGYIPKQKGVMGWKEYADFARTVDLAFSLMYTPHPSYPPFDMLTSGAVVLTNNYSNKRNLDYSKNMIMKELTIDDMLTGFAEGVELANDSVKREKNYQNNNIVTDWHEVFDSIVEDFAGRIEAGRYV